ncbi:serine hydrolase [Winogradskyella immobilis]|uniref:Serine hydrolase n=1 Tax=Winogradskyella immobilis TaxID=2816852 RepID=A0ABS8EPV7_9FLAO|nr:serine hydrolase [Winogradskyella immobilis]MCC1484867.1 serine hydrolase [Winogradskyella immobilis]MCG0016959.1 serine hydrolase [Winogradskyella immobilis]
MKRFLLLLITLCFASSFAQTDKRLKGLEDELNKILEITKTAGFAVAVVEGDKVIYNKGFGYRDYENKIPVDANTLFAIGSSTKAFTSAILGKLRADDKLSFDDSPRKYIPELEFYNDNLNNNIIIKDLMRHSTGIPRHDGAWYFFPSHNKDSLVQRIKYHEPFTGLRQRWYYNNFMFLTQGVIAEKITGKSWEDNLDEMFFKPLNMNRTNSDIKAMKSASNASIGYELKDDKISKMDYYDIAGMSPAGSINSSVNDMTKWMTLWLNKGKHNEEELLPESYIQEATGSQMVVSSGIPSKELPDMHFANYGYGWFTHSYKGHYVAEHGGNIDGFSTNVALYPTDSLGIVVLANQNGSATPNLVRNTVADYVLKLKKTGWASKHKKDLEEAEKAQEEVEESSESAQIPNTKPSHSNVDYTGVYSNKGYGAVTITTKNDSLFTILNKKLNYLHHFHYDTFELISVVKGKVDTTDYGQSLKATFSTGDSGDIDGFKVAIEPTIDPIFFKRSPIALDVDSSDLEPYTGDYEISGATIKFYLKGGKTLFLFVPGQPEYELLPTDKHKFTLKGIDGFKVEFIENDKGTIKEAKLFQPNGTFTVKRKE